MALLKTPPGAKNLRQSKDVKDRRDQYNTAFTYLLSAFADAYDKEGEYYYTNDMEKPTFMPQTPLGNCLTDVERLQQQNLSEVASLMGDFESGGGEESTMVRQLALEKMEQFVELEQWRFTQNAQSLASKALETEPSSRKDHFKGILESYGELALWRDDLKKRTVRHKAKTDHASKGIHEQIKPLTQKSSSKVSPNESEAADSEQLNGHMKNSENFSQETFQGSHQLATELNCRRRLNMSTGHSGSSTLVIETREAYQSYDTLNDDRNDEKNKGEIFMPLLNGDFTEACKSVLREGVGYFKVAFGIATAVFVSHFLNAHLLKRRNGKEDTVTRKSKSNKKSRTVNLPSLQVTEFSSVATVMVPRLPKGPPLG